MTPLETQLLAALRLRRATSHPHTPPPIGLGLPYEAEHTAYDAQTRRNIAADAAVDAAIAAGEAAENDGGWIEHVLGASCPCDPRMRVDVRLSNGKETGGLMAGGWEWGQPHLMNVRILQWRPSVTTGAAS